MRFENTQELLQNLKRGYVKRREAMRQQVQSLSAEHEAVKRSLNNHDVAKELEETEKRLKHYERYITYGVVTPYVLDNVCDFYSSC